MSGLSIPTSGVARRRAKSIARQRHIHASENDRLVAAGRLPVHWSAMDSCVCGAISWLEEGGSEEEKDDFYRAAEDHAAFCTGGSW